VRKDTLVEILRKRINSSLLDCRKFSASRDFFLVPAPLLDILEDVRLYPYFICLGALFPDKFPHPFIPPGLKLPQQHNLPMLVTNRIIDRVVINQFQMPQSPVVRDSSDEEVHCRVLNSEFTWIIRADAHSMTQS
jgi:hypothetical protein